MGWNEVTNFEAIPDIAKTDCLALLCFTGWSSVVDRRDRENAVLNASPGDFTLGPTGARATSASISAHGSTLCWRKRLWTIQWTIKKWQEMATLLMLDDDWYDECSWWLMRSCPLSWRFDMYDLILTKPVRFWYATCPFRFLIWQALSTASTTIQTICHCIVL